ncbi:hypothetical protein V8C26DRAFT_412556 [Trichoderma gracile]
MPSMFLFSCLSARSVTILIRGSPPLVPYCVSCLSGKPEPTVGESSSWECFASHDDETDKARERQGKTPITVLMLLCFLCLPRPCSCLLVMLRALSLCTFWSLAVMNTPLPCDAAAAALPCPRQEEGIHVVGIACCDAVTGPRECVDCACMPRYYRVRRCRADCGDGWMMMSG